MEAESYIAEYFNHYSWCKEYGDYGDGCALLAAKQMYDAGGNEAYFSFMKSYMDAFWPEQGGLRSGLPENFSADWAHGSRILSFLYLTTKEEKYRKALELVVDRLQVYLGDGSGNVVYQGEQPEEMMEELYKIQPFFMEYETVYGKKEKYNDIVMQFEKAQKIICGEEERQLRGTARYLAALVDTMDNMSIQIYEQYRKLQDMFCQTLKDVLGKRDAKSGLFGKDRGDGADKGIDIFGSASIGYCILKACRMGIVLKEKYVDAGMEIVEKLAVKGKPFEDKEEICALIMAYGQYLQIQREME